MSQSIRNAKAQKSRNGFCQVAVFLLAVLVYAAAAGAEVCKGSKVSAKTLKKYDGLLPLSQADQTTAIAEHLPFGAPQCTKLLTLKWYIVCYDTEKRIPLWVAYKLTAQDIVQRTRKDAFRTDPRLTDEENAHCADYAGSGFDRGHSAPNADFNRSAEAQADTYYFSNMSPQTKQLNEQRWAELEDHVRKWARKFGTVYVVMGAIFVGNDIHTVPSGRVAIPTEFFKIVLRKDDSGSMLAQTFILPNGSGPFLDLPGGPGTKAQKVDAFLLQHVTSVNFVKSLTGLEYFPGLPQAQRMNLEAQTPSTLWPDN